MSSPSTENYTLGKGVVYFNRYDFTNSKYTGERDLGNAPSFSYSVALEKLPHYSSRGGLKSKDKEIVSQMTPTISFSLDEVSVDNLALLTLAKVASVPQTTSTVTDETHVAYQGHRVELKYRGISSITVTNGDGSITYDSGDDYIVDTSLKDDKIGRIYIVEGGAITSGTSIDVSYTYATLTYTRIKAFAETQVEGFLRFVSDNPAGVQQELKIWRVSLTPSGETALIGDDWSTLSFTGEVLKDETNHSDSPYMDIIMNQVTG